MRVVLETIRRLGVPDTALLIASRATERLTRGRAQLRKYYFMAQPVPREPLHTGRGAGIVVEEVMEGDPRLSGFERPDVELARRYASASRCFATWQGGTLTGFLWFTERQYEEDEVRCTFRVHPHDHAVWDLDVHIVPRFRFGRTFALLWESAFAAMRARGVRWTISRVSAFNAESIRAHQRLGARRTGWALFFLWGSLQLTLTSLGQLKCRRLEHGPYPVIVVRSPESGAGGPRGTDELGVEPIAGAVAADEPRRPAKV